MPNILQTDSVWIEVTNDQLLMIFIKSSCVKSLDCCCGFFLNIIRGKGLGPNLSFSTNLLPPLWVQFSSVTQTGPTLCNPMDGSTQGFLVHHQLPEFTQTHVHQVGDAIQPSHPLSSSSLPALNLSQHQGLFKSISSLHQVAKVLAFQLQHQSFQWIFSTDFL